MLEPIFLFRSAANSFDVPAPIRLKCEELGQLLDANGTYSSNSKFLFEFYNLLIPYITDPDWCWQYGEQLNASDIDSINLVLITCESVSELMNLCCSYSHLYTTVSTSYEISNNNCKVEFVIPSIFQGQRWFHIHIVTAYMVSLLNRQFGVDIKDIAISIPLSQHNKLIANKLRSICRKFNHDCFTINFPAKYITNKNIKHNPIIHRRAVDECKNKAAFFNQSDNISEKILTLLSGALDSTPSINEIAKLLNTSERNIRKKLIKENTSFRTLVLDYKFIRSCSLLKHSTLKIDEIGIKVGYSSPSSFRRAFSKKYGMTPSSYRKRLQDNPNNDTEIPPIKSSALTVP
ncbi:MAG: AraC family transcriptional regulator [Bermanella sp.]